MKASTHRHVVLLGDVKGTKAYLTEYIEGRSADIIGRISDIQDCFAQTVLEFMSRSRSMRAATFSDSLFAVWDDYAEAKRTALPLAVRLWERIAATGLPTRVYLNEGVPVEERSAVAQAVGTTVGRYVRVTPVSSAVWSVFAADESHFPLGVYVGEQLRTWRVPDGYMRSEEVHMAGQFSFYAVSAMREPQLGR